MRRPTNIRFAIWEVRLAESLCEVAGPERTAEVGSDRRQQAEFHLEHDGCEALVFRPSVWVEVTHDDDAVFHAGWVAIFVRFEGCDGEGRESVDE